MHSITNVRIVCNSIVLLWKSNVPICVYQIEQFDLIWWCNARLVHRQTRLRLRILVRKSSLAGEARPSGIELAPERGAQVYARARGRLIRRTRARTESGCLAGEAAFCGGGLASPRAGRSCGSSATARQGPCALVYDILFIRAFTTFMYKV